MRYVVIGASAKLFFKFRKYYVIPPTLLLQPTYPALIPKEP